MEIEPRNFENIPLNSYEPSECSPESPGPSWRGMVIRAPERVTFEKGRESSIDGAFAAIPICGYYLIEYSQMPEAQAMRFVATDIGTGIRYFGDLLEQDESPEEPEPDDEPADPEELEGMASGGYFNSNLAHYVELPEASGLYDVYVEWGETRSNVVRIEVVAR